MVGHIRVLGDRDADHEERRSDHVVLWVANVIAAPVREVDAERLERLPVQYMIKFFRLHHRRLLNRDPVQAGRPTTSPSPGSLLLPPGPTASWLLPRGHPSPDGAGESS